MRCFEHINREAIGSCVECGKGICLDCLYKIDNKIFCSACAPSSHKALSSITKQVHKIAEIKPTPIATTSGSTMVTTNRKREIAAILAFILGSIGGHKFYVGEYGWGFLYFLFSWTGIPMVAGWIEGLVYLVRTEEDFIRRYGTPVLPGQNIYATPQISSSASTAQLKLEAVKSGKSGKGKETDYERLLLQFSQRHEGIISLALLMSETEINLDKAEAALANLAAKGLVQADMDDHGRTTYYVPEFRHRLEEN